MAAIIANNQQQQSSVFPIKVFELNGSEEKWKEEKADNLETVQCDDAIGSSVQDEEEDRSSSLMSDECKQKQQQVKHDGCQIVSAPNPQPNEATNSRKMTNPVNAAYVETSLDDLSYTSGEASGPDADEEEERRLIARLQMENKQRQQEQQMAGQRQQQPLDPQQANQKAPNRAGETPVGGAQQALMEEQQRAASAKNVPPQVPVRRSSRVARMSSDCQVQQAADNCSLHQRRLATRNVAPPNRQHPRAAPPVPLAQTSLFGTATVAGRLPTRQPPMQVPPPQPPPPPPPPPRGHQRRRAPKNIWSPSSSSVMSSSFEEDEEQPASQPNDTHTSDEQFPRVESPATLQSESSPPPPTKVVREQQVLISELVSDEQRAADNELDRQLAQDRWSGRTSLDEPATATSTATSGTAETTIANKPLRTEDYELQQQKKEQAGNKVADDEKQAAEVVGGISRAPVSSCGAASRSTPIGELGGSPFAGHERGGANSNWRSFSVSLANPARANEQIPRLQGQRMMRGQTLRSFSVAVATPPAAKLRQQQSGEAQSAPGTKDDEREAVCGPATLPRDSGLSEATRAKTNSDWQLQQQRRQRQRQQQEPPQQQLDPKQGPHQSESNDDATQLAQCASEQHSGNSASAAEAVVGNSINGQANVVSGQQSDMPEAATATAAAIAMAMASAEQQTIPMVLASSALETSTMAPASLEQLQTADQRARESDSVGVAGAELANRHNKQAHSMTLDPNENELERGQMEYEDCDEQKPSSGFYKSTTVTSKTTVTKSKDEWFQQMYKQMHSGPSTSKPTAERSILNAVNEQNRRLRDTKSGDQLIKIKLKSPRNEYRSSFFDEDSDLAHRHSPSDSSPAAQAARATKTLAPNIGLATNERHFSRQTSGLASDHLPEQSSMSQQQRNLDLGSQSVWPQTHTEHKRIYPCHLRGDSPIRHLNDNQDEGHEKRCVFSRLIKDEPSAFQQQASTGGSLDRKLAATTSEYPEDSHKQYVAVQQGQDIPLKGLRRPPPQANVYKDHMFSDKSINIHYKTPASRLLKMNTFNEFELNRLKKYYAEELAQRLQRTRSSSKVSNTSGRNENQVGSRLSAPAGQWSSGGSSPSPLLPPLPRRFQSPCSLALSSEDYGRAAGHQVVDLKRYQHALSSSRSRRRSASSSQPIAGGRTVPVASRFARALYDFQAKHDGEISVKRGDLVEILGLVESARRQEGGSGEHFHAQTSASAANTCWANIEDCQSGLQGLMPLSYLDHSVGCAVAKRDVQTGTGSAGFGSRTSSRASHQQQHRINQESGLDHLPVLPMSKGEPIVLLHRLSGHLYEASNTRQSLGLVWSNDVDIIKQPVHVEPSGQQHQQRDMATNTDDENELEPDIIDDVADEFTDDDEELNFDRREVQPESMLQRSSHHQVSSRVRPQNKHAHCPAKSKANSQGVYDEGVLYDKSNRQHLANSNLCPCCQQIDNSRGMRGTETTDSAKAHNFDAQRQFYSHQPPAPKRSSSSPMIGIESVSDSVCSQQQQSATMGRNQQKYKRGEFETNRPFGERVDHGDARQLPWTCRARFAYKPRQKDELELVVGDILVVVHECDDGWLIGSSYGTKQTGTFPGNFVEPI